MSLSFFIVFYQETSSDKLEIPKPDSLDMLVSLLRGVFLRDQYGNKWPVKLAIIDNQLHFEKGWSKFVKDNSIEDGDFLIFQYDDDKVIDVKLTGKNACDKKGVGALKFIETEEEHVEAESIDVEMEEVGEIEVEEPEYDEPFGELADEEDQEGSDEESEEHEDDQNFGELVDEATQESSEEEKQEESSDEEVKEWQAKRKEIQIKRELSKLKKKVNILANKLGEHEYIDVDLGGSSSVHIVAAAAPKSGDAKRGRRKNPDYYGTKIFKSGIVPRPTNPYFVTEIRPKRREELYIPREVLKDIGLKHLPKKAILRDSSGRTWTTYRTQWSDGRKFFVEGWASFCRTNYVGDNDHCVCEFIRGINPKKDLTIQIQVVPANNNANLIKDQQKKT